MIRKLFTLGNFGEGRLKGELIASGLDAGGNGYEVNELPKYDQGLKCPKLFEMTYDVLRALIIKGEPDSVVWRQHRSDAGL